MNANADKEIMNEVRNNLKGYDLLLKGGRHFLKTDVINLYGLRIKDIGKVLANFSSYIIIDTLKVTISNQIAAILLVCLQNLISLEPSFSGL